MEAKSIRIGEETLSVAPFRAFKAVYAGDMVSRVSEQVNALMNKQVAFRREYVTTNFLRITREVAELRGWENFPEGRDYVDIPEEPSQEQVVLHVFGEAFKIAKDEVLQLLALVLIPNADLQRAEEAGRVQEELAERGKQLLFAAEMGQLIELTALAIDMVQGQLDERKEALGKIRSLWSRGETSPQTPPDGGTNGTQAPEVPEFNHRIRPATVEFEQTQDSSADNSSTDSQQPTAGVASGPSSESPS